MRYWVLDFKGVPENERKYKIMHLENLGVASVKHPRRHASCTTLMRLVRHVDVWM